MKDRWRICSGQGDRPLIQTSSHYAAMWEHQSDDLAECDEKVLLFVTTFSRPFRY